MNKIAFLIVAGLISMISCGNKNKNMENNSGSTISDTEMYLLVGTYTSGDSKGIYVYKFDTVSGESQYKSMVEVSNPSYLTVSQNEKYVYAVTETGDDFAAANAFSFNKEEGSLSFLNSQPTTGADPCYITVSNDNRYVITANYSGGSISVFDVREDGSLDPVKQLFSFEGKGAHPERQTKPHLHFVSFSPDERFMFANDLGTDKIYKFDVQKDNQEEYLKEGNPAFFKVAAGSGPRHMAFHPDGKYAYLITEMSGAVIVFSYDAEGGNLKEIQSIQADTLYAKGSADIHVSPDGKFLYASNRLKGDGLAIFSIEQADGKLTKKSYQQTGAHPRNFVITPDGKYLLVASRDDNVIQVFRRDESTGLLTSIDKDIKLDKPVCLKLVSAK